MTALHACGNLTFSCPAALTLQFIMMKVKVRGGGVMVSLRRDQNCILGGWGGAWSWSSRVRDERSRLDKWPAVVIQQMMMIPHIGLRSYSVNLGSLPPYLTIEPISMVGESAGSLPPYLTIVPISMVGERAGNATLVCLGRSAAA
jgi:hypothetical protein